MGLDMYLNKRTYIGAEYEHREVAGEIKLTQKGKPINIQLKRISDITERVGYWRKANAIHNWFVKNVQKGVDDCGEYYVSEDDLRKLLADCNAVLAAEKQAIATVAADILPTKSGFFFGGTEYDEYYLQDIKETIAIIEPILANEEYKEADIYYSSSW